MKSFQFQKITKKILPYAFFCGLILLFSYRAPLTGGDLLLSARVEQGGIGIWFQETGASGGNYLSALLGAVMVDIPVLYHLLFAAMMSVALITLVFFCDAQRPYMYFVILFLGLGAPAGIFAYSFTRAAGAATVMIPAFLALLHMFTVADLFVYKGQKKVWKIPFLFLSGFAVQMFSESIGIALFLVSLVCLILLWKRYGFSWHLASHCFGCIGGLTLSLILSGSHDAFVGSFYAMVDQFAGALDQLFIENLLLMGVLTLSCLLLIQPIRSERSKNCNITLCLLLISLGLFAVLNVANDFMVAFSTIYRVLTILKLIAALAYCLGVLRTIQHYVSKDKVIYRGKYAFLTVWIFIIVYGFTGTALPNMLYIPYLLLAGVTGLLLGYSFRHYDRMEKVIRKPLLFAAIAGVLALSLITISNGSYWEVVDTHTKESLNAGNTKIVLPIAPFEERLAPTDYEVLSQYYNFPNYGEVELVYVPYKSWDWKTYYEAHNIPVIEEYDEKKEKEDEWAFELEEE